MPARIYGANIIRANVTGTFGMMAMSKTRSGPPSAIWIRAFVIGIAPSASARWGRGPRVMRGASCSYGLVFSWCVASFLLNCVSGPFDKEQHLLG